MCSGSSGSGLDLIRAIAGKKKAADGSSSSGGLFALPANAKPGSSRASQRMAAPLSKFMTAFGPQMESPLNG